MSESTHFLASHGGLLLFAVVFLEQIGLPIPTAPWLLGAGALWAMGLMNPFLAFGVTVAEMASEIEPDQIGEHRASYGGAKPRQPMDLAGTGQCAGREQPWRGRQRNADLFDENRSEQNRRTVTHQEPKDFIHSRATTSPGGSEWR
jgi:hypothetical protein